LKCRATFRITGRTFRSILREEAKGPIENFDCIRNFFDVEMTDLSGREQDELA